MNMELYILGGIVILAVIWLAVKAVISHFSDI